MVTLMSWTVCWRFSERASVRGADSKISSDTSCDEEALRSHSTSERTPAWATSMTQARWSAGSSRNQGRTSSIRATLAVASAPAFRSIRRSVAGSSSGAMRLPSHAPDLRRRASAAGQPE
jgi:hypothetical protein